MLESPSMVGLVEPNGAGKTTLMKMLVAQRISSTGDIDVDGSDLGTFIEPILVFLVPSVVFVFGLSMAVGRLSAKLVYGLVPIVLFAGVFCFRLPVWVDLCGNNFLTGYFRMLVLNRGSAEMVYYLPTSLILSRWLLVVAGVLLLAISCRKLRSV